MANLLKDKNGTYVIINNDQTQAGYSGHVDGIINEICIGGAYTVTSGALNQLEYAH